MPKAIKKKPIQVVRQRIMAGVKESAERYLVGRDPKDVCELFVKAVGKERHATIAHTKRAPRLEEVRAVVAELFYPDFTVYMVVGPPVEVLDDPRDEFAFNMQCVPKKDESRIVKLGAKA